MNCSSVTPTRPVVICGPSGCGKSTIISALVKRYPNKFYYCVSHTTRPKRPDEEHGVDYYFVTDDEFKTEKRNGNFVEFTLFAGYYYATSKSELEKTVNEGRICLMDVDIQGMEKMKNSVYNPICIFIRPRNFAVLEHRLRSRSTETEDRILQRLAVAHQEMQYGLSEGRFDAVLVNDNLDRSVEELVQVICQLTANTGDK